MKCPHCGIHYDDGERECPMCGARKPVFQKDPSQLARATGQLARPQRREKKDPSWLGEYMTQSCAHPKEDNCPHTTTINGRKQKVKKKKNPARIVFLVIILLNVLPVLLEIGADLIGNAADLFSNSMAAREPAWPDDNDILTPAAPMPEQMPDECPAAGVWNMDDTPFELLMGQELYLEYGLPEYVLHTGEGYREQGVYSYNLCRDASVYPEHYPAEKYDWYTICLQPNEMDLGTLDPGDFSADVDEYLNWGGYLEVFVQRDDPTIAFFCNWHDVPWLESGVEFSAFSTGEGDVADLLIGITREKV